MLKKFVPYLVDFFKRADMILLLLCTAASVFGIVVISSAAASYGSSSFVIVQTGAFLLGVVVFILFTIIDVDIISSKWMLLYALSFILILLLRTPLGYEDNTGNRAWLRFFGVGIQPSEVVKVIFIVIMSKHISYLREYKRLDSVLSVGQLLVHFVLPVGFLV